MKMECAGMWHAAGAQPLQSSTSDGEFTSTISPHDSSVSIRTCPYVSCVATRNPFGSVVTRKRGSGSKIPGFKRGMLRQGAKHG